MKYSDASAGVGLECEQGTIGERFIEPRTTHTPLSFGQRSEPQTAV